MDKRLLLIFLCISLSGCSVAKHADQLLTLKAFATAQDEINKDVSLSREHFDKMLEDYREGSIKEGLRKSFIISTYGPPVLTKVGDAEGVDEIFIYRDPLKYLSSDKLYISFNEKNKIVDMEYIQFTRE
ncbi:MAG: hypothetical protein ABH848_00440 [Candidatus Omnitrophota bacterium]